MLDSFDSRLSFYDRCRELDDAHRATDSGSCDICADQAEHSCDTCAKSFCAEHICIVRPHARYRETLAKICDSCQQEHMADATRMLLGADDHQRINPFDMRYHDAICAAFADGINLGVWDWRRAA